jgi:hypothetical protein
MYIQLHKMWEFSWPAEKLLAFQGQRMKLQNKNTRLNLSISPQPIIEYFPDAFL